MNIILNKEANASVIFGDQVRVNPSSEALLLKKLYDGNISTDRLIALDVFVETLKKNNLWDKITTLFVPSLFVGNTSLLKNAFIDVKKTYGQSALSFGVGADTLSDSEYTFSTDGLTRNTTVQYTYAGRGVTLSDNFSAVDSHFLFYKTGGTFSVEDNKDHFIMYPSYIQASLAVNLTSDNKISVGCAACYAKRTSTSAVDLDANNVIYGGGFTGFNSDSNTVQCYVINDSEIEYNGLGVTNTEKINVTQKHSVVGIPGAYGLFSFGTSLSKVEATMYCKAIKTFMEKIR